MEGESQRASPPGRPRRHRPQVGQLALPNHGPSGWQPAPALEANPTPTRRARSRRAAVVHLQGPGSAPGGLQARPALASPEVPGAGGEDRSHAAGSA
eukprot:10550573-Heterocapsa_arctica.AAC.1